MTIMLHISALSRDQFRKLQSFRNRDNEMEYNSENETAYATQYEDGFLQSIENE